MYYSSCHRYISVSENRTCRFKEHNFSQRGRKEIFEKTCTYFIILYFRYKTIFKRAIISENTSSISYSNFATYNLR